MTQEKKKEFLLKETRIKVDFIEVEYHLFRKHTFQRVQFEENYTACMLPNKGDYIVIGNNLYCVEQLTYFPFGDSEGQIGVRVHLSKCSTHKK